MNTRGWDTPAALPAPEGAAAAPAAARLGRMPWEAVIVAAALAVFTAALAPALQETGTPPAWDPAVHLRDSLVVERILRQPTVLHFATLRAILKGSEDYPLLTPSGYYPPLVPAVTALLYLLAGHSYGTAMVTSLVFLALLAWGILSLGNHLLGPPAGLLAALLVLAAPGIRQNAGEYMLDLPLAALVVLSVRLLLATGGFSRRGLSLAFGALCGAGMLVKWSFFLFLGAPVALVLFGAPAPGVPEAGPGRRWKNLGLAILAGSALIAPYYAPILPILIRKTLVHAGGAADGFRSTFSLESAVFHLEALPRKLLGWPLTLAVAAGILLFPWKQKEARRSGVFLGLWALSLYALFTFAVANKQSRYLLPWLPVLALMGAAGIARLWRRETGSASLARTLAGLGLLALPVFGLGGGWRPEDSGDWQVRQLVGRLEADLAPRSPDRGRAWKLGVIPDMQRINGPTVAYYVSRRDLPVTVVQLVNRMKRHVAVEVGLDPFDRGDFYQTFDAYDYLVTKTGENAVPPWESVVPAMQRYFEERRGEFAEVARFREPDGSTLALYRRNRG